MIEAEEAERKSHSIRYQMGIAKLPLARDLDGLSFEDAAIEHTEIDELNKRPFMEHAHKLLFVGGTGKTYLAIATGRHSVRQGKHVRFFSVVDLVNPQKQERWQGDLVR